VNGDNGVLQFAAGCMQNYLRCIDIFMDSVAVAASIFADGLLGSGVPRVGGDISFDLATGQTIYGALEARAGYASTAGETITVILEGILD
jgi:hypothetical protein